MKTDTARIAAGVEEIAKRFDALAAQGGIIPSAKTPEEHYHNARIHELGGNFAAARKEYTEYLGANLDVIDPWLSYSADAEGAGGPRRRVETMRYFGDKGQSAHRFLRDGAGAHWRKPTHASESSRRSPPTS